MPSQMIHEMIDKAVFNRTFPEIHRIKDAPFDHLGPLHRILYHDPLYNLFISGNPGPAFVHDIADILTTPAIPILLITNPEYVL